MLKFVAMALGIALGIALGRRWILKAEPAHGVMVSISFLVLGALTGHFWGKYKLEAR